MDTQKIKKFLFLISLAGCGKSIDPAPLGLSLAGSDNDIPNGDNESDGLRAARAPAAAAPDSAAPELTAPGPEASAPSVRASAHSASEVIPEFFVNAAWFKARLDALGVPYDLQGRDCHLAGINPNESAEALASGYSSRDRRIYYFDPAKQTVSILVQEDLDSAWETIVLVGDGIHWAPAVPGVDVQNIHMYGQNADGAFVGELDGKTLSTRWVENLHPLNSDKPFLRLKLRLRD